MMPEKVKQETFAVWVDHKEKILSFSEMEGYEALAFSSRDVWFYYIDSHVRNGYRIR